MKNLPPQIPRRQHGALITALKAMATFPHTAPKNDAAHRAIVQAIATYWEDRVVQLMKKYSQSTEWKQYLSDRNIAVKQQMLQAFFARVSTLSLPAPARDIAAELAKELQKSASAVDRVQKAKYIHDFFTSPAVSSD